MYASSCSGALICMPYQCCYCPIPKINYAIERLVDDSNLDHIVGSEYSNIALFEVDENGKYTIIATPKYDELRVTYFYGDYAAKKI